MAIQTFGARVHLIIQIMLEKRPVTNMFLMHKQVRTSLRLTYLLCSIHRDNSEDIWVAVKVVVAYGKRWGKTHSSKPIRSPRNFTLCMDIVNAICLFHAACIPICTDTGGFSASAPASNGANAAPAGSETIVAICGADVNGLNVLIRKRRLGIQKGWVQVNLDGARTLVEKTPTITTISGKPRCCQFSKLSGIRKYIAAFGLPPGRSHNLPQARTASPLTSLHPDNRHFKSHAIAPT
jgi:hypothetical protein